MPWLRFIYRVLALGPALFLGAIGLHARTFVDPYDPIGLSPIQQSSVLEYRELVQTSAALKCKSPAPEVIENAATKWEAFLSKRNVFDLTPVAIDDTCEDGVRSEIFDAHLLVARGLIATAQQDLKAGNGDRAATEFVRATEFLEGLKYIDYMAYSVAGVSQRRALDFLSKTPVTEPELAVQLSERIEQVRAQQSRFGYVVHIVRQRYRESIERLGQLPTSVEDPLPQVAIEGQDTVRLVRPLIASRASGSLGLTTGNTSYDRLVESMDRAKTHLLSAQLRTLRIRF